MEFADSLRNELFKSTNMELFGSNNVSHLVHTLTSLIINMENLVLAYNKLESNSFELKNIIENFGFAEHIVDKNLWSRDLKPHFERKEYESSETSIAKVSPRINQPSIILDVKGFKKGPTSF